MIFILGVFLAIGGPLSYGQSIHIQTSFDLKHFSKSFDINRPPLHIPFLTSKIFTRFGNHDSSHLRENYQTKVNVGDQSFYESKSDVNPMMSTIKFETKTTTTSKNIADKTVTDIKNNILSIDNTESTTYSDETTDFTTETTEDTTTEVPDYDELYRISSQVVASLLG